MRRASGLKRCAGLAGGDGLAAGAEHGDAHPRVTGRRALVREFHGHLDGGPLRCDLRRRDEDAPERNAQRAGRGQPDVAIDAGARVPARVLALVAHAHRYHVLAVTDQIRRQVQGEAASSRSRSGRAGDRSARRRPPCRRRRSATPDARSAASPASWKRFLYQPVPPTTQPVDARPALFSLSNGPERVTPSGSGKFSMHQSCGRSSARHPESSKEARSAPAVSPSRNRQPSSKDTVREASPVSDAAADIGTASTQDTNSAKRTSRQVIVTSRTEECRWYPGLGRRP